MEFKEKYNFKGWQNSLYLSNGDIDIIATTDIGPRIMRLGFIGEQNLFLEIEDEVGKSGGNNYRLFGGSRLWHSPEANPRSYIPDNDPIIYQWKNNVLKLVQNIEKETGMLKEISLKMSNYSNKIEVNYKIHNKNVWPIEFAPWALTLMAKNGRAIIPQEFYRTWDDYLLPARPLVLWHYTKMNDERWLWGEKYIQLKQDPDSNSPQKIGLLNKLSWEAYYLNGFVFIKRYSFNPNAKYPDYNCNTEVYTDPNLFELETLGPLQKIDPDDYIEHKENWYLFKVKINEDENSIDTNLLPLINKTKVPK